MTLWRFWVFLNCVGGEIWTVLDLKINIPKEYFKFFEKKRISYVNGGGNVEYSPRYKRSKLKGVWNCWENQRMLPGAVE